MIDTEKDSTIIGSTYAVLLALFALPFYLMYENKTVTFNQKFIQSSDAFGRKKKFKWEEIEKITLNSHLQLITVLKGKTKMKFNSQLVGIDTLTKTITERTNLEINII